MSDIHHKMSIYLERDGNVRFLPKCTAPEGALCRMVCTCDAEEYAYSVSKAGQVTHSAYSVELDDDVEHVMHDGGECNVVNYLDNSDCIDEDVTGLPDGGLRLAELPFVPEWQGEWYSWKPVDTPKQ